MVPMLYYTFSKWVNEEASPRRRGHTSPVLIILAGIFKLKTFDLGLKVGALDVLTWDV